MAGLELLKSGQIVGYGLEIVLLLAYGIIFWSGLTG